MEMNVREWQLSSFELSVCVWVAVLVWCNGGAGRVSPPTRALCWCSGGATELTVRGKCSTRKQHSRHPSTINRGREGEERTDGVLGDLTVRGVELDWIMATSTSCTGSTLLQPISKIIDLPLDQVNCHFNWHSCFAFVISLSKDS